MPVDFSQFSPASTIPTSAYFIGYDKNESGGERKWTLSTVANAVSGIMSPQLSNINNINVVDSPTIDLNWNASTRTLSADVSSINSFFTGTGTQLLSSSGYQKLPGGLIIQWGNVIDDWATYSFPIAFPTSCLHMTAAAKVTAGGASMGDSQCYIRSNSQYTVYVGDIQNNANQSAYWLAIGY